MELTQAEQLKFELLADGLRVSRRAAEYLADRNHARPLTPADYASTSGLILRLDNDVWVNAPTIDHNPNFVTISPYVLDLGPDGLYVRGNGRESGTQCWLPPAYHGELGSNGKPFNYYAFTHSDRVRISPVMGCSMTCKFCNIPYEDRYGTKPVSAIVEAVRTALGDPIQPASHMLISGGTPKEPDIGYLRDVYELTLTEFPGLEIDIMMVPIDGLLDLERLDRLGVHEFSINLEIINDERAARLMRQKFGRGLAWYLDFLEKGTEVLGPGRIRSMLMVGLEPPEETLAGVGMILDRGCVPVLSPFRPSPSTPLRDVAPPDAEELRTTYLRAREIAETKGLALGPDCPPCTHNTLTLFPGEGQAEYRHPLPLLV